MIVRNILLISFIAVAASKHHHNQNAEMDVEQTPVVYVAAVAAGFPVTSSSDLLLGSGPNQAVINKIGALAGSGYFDAWQAGFSNTNQWL